VKKRSNRGALRADTTVAPVGDPRREIYVRELPKCCLRALKAAVLSGPAERDGVREQAFDCECGKSWLVASSLDERVLERFVASGRRDGFGGGPSAA